MNTQNSIILLIKLLGYSEKWNLIGINPHVIELNFLLPVPANKMELFSTTHIAEA